MFERPGFECYGLSREIEPRLVSNGYRDYDHDRAIHDAATDEMAGRKVGRGKVRRDDARDRQDRAGADRSGIVARLLETSVATRPVCCTECLLSGGVMVNAPGAGGMDDREN